MTTRRIFAALSVLAGFAISIAISSPAHAACALDPNGQPWAIQPVAPPHKISGAPTAEDVRFAPDCTPMAMPSVFDPWTEASIRQRYGFGHGPLWLSTLNSIVNLTIAPVLGPLADSFDKGAAEKIATGCKTRYPHDYWLQTRCASEAVDLTLESVRYDADGVKGARSFCRDHAQAFKQVFDLLNIPRSNVGTEPLDGHIVNRITFLSTDGRYYSYIVDTGWDPGKVWPFNDAAIRRADPNGDGHTDVASLPAMGGTEGRFTGVPWAAAVASVSGSNVPRGGSTGARGTSVAGSAGARAGGGVAR